MTTVVGAGFAGVEAAWAIARAGIPVRLVEMRPEKSTPAHVTEWFAELVCSNSFKSRSPTSPAGQLKAEMLALGSLVIETALEHEVPGGEALCVDRERFGQAITRKIEAHPLIEIERREFLPEEADRLLDSGEFLILATGPLTSPAMSDWLAVQSGREHLYFYDAVSPTVDASTLNRDVVFAASRYGKGEGDDYLNCPFDRESYFAFVRELVSAERAPIHAFEAGGRRDPSPGSLRLPTSPARGEVSPHPVRFRLPTSPARGEVEFLETVKYFSGCTPIEAIAEKGEMSLAFGNFKPVGLTDPRTGRRPFAALQLRPENREKTLYSLVACQTRLKWGEQRRVFRMVPGLESAEFVRYGVIHRNTYVEAPKLLTPWLEFRDRHGLFVTGQLTGVEGYVESAAMGIYVGLAAVAKLKGLEPTIPPRETAYGSLVAHLMNGTEREFAPMNINWGLFPEPPEGCRDKGIRRQRKLEAAQLGFEGWLEELGKSVEVSAVVGRASR